MSDIDSSDVYVSIGELARATGVTTRTLRYYEEVGIIEPPRRLEGGSRVYTDSGIRKLKFILRLKEMGLTIKEMQELTTADIKARQSIKIVPYLVEMLNTNIDKLDDKMSELATSRKAIVKYRHIMIDRVKKLPVRP